MVLANIARIHTDRSGEFIYLHFGEPLEYGTILLEHYQTDEQVQALLDLGSLRSIGPITGEKVDSDKRVSKKPGFGPNGAASAGSSQSAPMPHRSPAAPRNPCSNAAADPANRKSAPPPNAAIAPQNRAAQPGATQSPIGSPNAPVPTPTTPRHDTRRQPKSAPLACSGFIRTGRRQRSSVDAKPTASGPSNGL